MYCGHVYIHFSVTRNISELVVISVIQINIKPTKSIFKNCILNNKKGIEVEI